jgi:coenzyme PQQ precursor peptide PqqA
LHLKRLEDSLAWWLAKASPGRNPDNKEETTMQWEVPDFVEISVGCEINSYATAEI